MLSPDAIRKKARDIVAKSGLALTRRNVDDEVARLTGQVAKAQARDETLAERERVVFNAAHDAIITRMREDYVPASYRDIADVLNAEFGVGHFTKGNVAVRYRDGKGARGTAIDASGARIAKPKGRAAHKSTPPSVWDRPEVMERLETLHRSGNSLQEIADDLTALVGFEVTRNAVLGKVTRTYGAARNAGHHRNGITPPAPKTPAQKAAIAAFKSRVALAISGPDSGGSGTNLLAKAVRREPVISARAIDAYALNLTLLELGADQCRWPLGERGIYQLYCGLRCDPKGGGYHSYCPDHRAQSSSGTAFKAEVIKPRHERLRGGRQTADLHFRWGRR